jgi:hypothetical protein
MKGIVNVSLSSLLREFLKNKVNSKNSKSEGGIIHLPHFDMSRIMISLVICKPSRDSFTELKLKSKRLSVVRHLSVPKGEIIRVEINRSVSVSVFNDLNDTGSSSFPNIATIRVETN